MVSPQFFISGFLRVVKETWWFIWVYNDVTFSIYSFRARFGAQVDNDSLWWLEVSVDDLVEMEIVHPSSDAHGPVHQQGRMDLPACSQHLVELALGAVLHNNAVTWSLGTNTPRSVKEETCYRIVFVAKNTHVLMASNSFVSSLISLSIKSFVCQEKPCVYSQLAISSVLALLLNNTLL